MNDRYGLEYDSRAGVLSVYKNSRRLGEVACGMQSESWRPFVELVYAGDSVRLHDSLRAPDYLSKTRGAIPSPSPLSPTAPSHEGEGEVVEREIGDDEETPTKRQPAMAESEVVK